MTITSDTTFTKSKQVTVPAKIERALGLKPGDKLVVKLEGDTITLSRPRFTLESAFGSVPLVLTTEQINEAVTVSREHRAKQLKTEL